MPRIKICIWRLINNIIPSKLNLIAKGIETNPLCVFCRSKEESTIHHLWGCKFSKEIWQAFFPSLHDFFANCRSNWKLINFWKGISERLDKEELKRATILLWNLWSYRNKNLEQWSQSREKAVPQRIRCSHARAFNK